MALRALGSTLGDFSKALVSRPALQPTIFVVLALIFIWVIRPTDNDSLKIPFLTVVVLIPFISNYLHRDRLRDLGLRLDNLSDSLREVGIATAIGAVAILAIGALAGVEPHFGRRAMSSLLLYPGWGLVQQYAMQSFTYRRVRESTHRPGAAAVTTAVLFAIVHYPNLALAGTTLVGGYVWCRLFERHPNLLTLALSHGWLAVLLRASWPAHWLHSLTIGPDYWMWRP
ncbi:MAG: CPBP family glutamic-type intramembrane protease [Gemmatimonadales bacterium]|jgi:hypothetical protein